MTVFMCKTDWEWHVGNDMMPSKVYSSEKDIRRERSCVDQCGIVAVEMRLVRIVQDENFGELAKSAVDE